MNDEAALLLAIREHPSDDTPRLVYADELDGNHPECADPRAEFIRVQIEDRVPATIRTVAAYHAVQAFDLRPNGRKIVDLLRVWGMAWLHDFPVWPGFSPLDDVVWNRGFIEEIRLPLAAFIGETCKACGVYDVNVRSMRPGVGTPSCRTCSGTGRVGGCAAAIFREHPVTRVVATNVEPAPYDGVECYWVRGHNPSDGNVWGNTPNLLVMDEILPADIFDILASSEKADMGEWIMVYSSRELAITALSDAFVVYGRGAAGLSPLPRRR